MDNSSGTLISFIFIILGVVIIKLRTPIGQKAAEFYRKIGIEVPEELYTKQFMFIGVLLMIVGFLGATGLLSQI